MQVCRYAGASIDGDPCVGSIISAFPGAEPVLQSDGYTIGEQIGFKLLDPDLPEMENTGR
jgi:hypothetical protein